MKNNNIMILKEIIEILEHPYLSSYYKEAKVEKLLQKIKTPKEFLG